MSTRTNQKIWPVIVIFLLVTAAPTFAGQIIYVDDDAAGINDGSSWTDAFNYLQDALAAAWSGDEIRVAQGIYKPDQGEEFAPGDRWAAFRLDSGVTITGGYGGLCESDPDARDVEKNETILSGDLNGNDMAVEDPCELLTHTSRNENSYHVVTCFEMYSMATLDGLTISGGNANYTLGWPPRHAGNCGGGMYNESGSATLIECTFRKNSARFGGGMYNSNMDGPCNPLLKECTFFGNYAHDGGGGAMYNYGCHGYYRGGPYPKVVSCVFNSNSTQHNGGGMCNWDSTPTVMDCTFINNSALKAGGGMCNDGACDTSLANCSFTANSANSGGGMYNWGDPEYKCYPNLNNCIFSDNVGDAHGGGIFSYGYCYLKLRGCRFNCNMSEFGGGISNYGQCSGVITNCVLGGNLADSGGGIYQCCPLYRPGFNLSNCTFIGNSANNGSGLVCDLGGKYNYSTYRITNCILWDGPSEICINDNSKIAVTYSSVQGGLRAIYDPCGGLIWGAGNIDADPFFADAGKEDYHLLVDSPCIDAGDPNYIASPNETDLDGKPRVLDGNNDGITVIDMGAYEHQYTIPAEARIIPRTLNLASKGQWITCYIWLPEDYNVTGIDPNSILLNYKIQAESVQVNEQQQVVMARFRREQLQAILNTGQVELSITGQLTDGTIFEATDAIRVTDKAVKKTAK